MKTFIIGDRVKFRKDDVTGTIVRAFRGSTIRAVRPNESVEGDRMNLGPTYLVRLDKPDEDGRLRGAGAGEIELEDKDYQDYLAGRTDPRD